MTQYYLPDGTMIRKPPEMTMDEFQAKIAEQFNRPAPTPPPAPVAQTTQDPSYLDRVNARLGEERMNIQDTLALQTGQAQMEAAALGQEPPRSVGTVEGAVQNTASLARAGMAPFAAGVDELFQEIDDFTGGKVSESWSEFMDSNFGKAASAMFRRGGEVWDNFKSKYPVTARTIGDTVELGLIGLEGNPGKKMAQYMAPSDRIGGRNQTDENIFRVRTYKPTEFELEVGDAVARVPRTTPTRSYTFNYARVEDQVDRLKARLDAQLLRAGNPKVDLKKLDQEFSDLMEWGDQIDEFRGLSPQAQRYTEQILEEARGLLQNTDGGALDVLNARRKLDRWVEKRFGEKAFDADLINGRNVANQVIRRKLNEAVIAAAPEVDVKDLLKEQSLLMRGLDKLGDHRRAQAGDPIKRFLDRTIREPLGAGTVGALGAGAMAYQFLQGIPADTLSVLATGGGATMLAYRSLSTAQRRKLAGAMLMYYSQNPDEEGADQARQVAKDLLEVEADGNN